MFYVCPICAIRNKEATYLFILALVFIGILPQINVYVCAHTTEENCSWNTYFADAFTEARELATAGRQPWQRITSVFGLRAQRFARSALRHSAGTCQQYRPGHRRSGQIRSQYSRKFMLTCDHFVGEVSAMGQPTTPTQPSIPPGSTNE